MTALVVLIVFLFTILRVSGKPTIETNIDGVSITSGYPGRSRRTHSHLPKFSKKDKGKGKGAVYIEDDEYVWVYETKSSKSKSSKKDSKKEKYVRATRKPTEAQFPTISPPPSSMDKSHSKSGSSSEDCPRKSNKFKEKFECKKTFHNSSSDPTLILAARPPSVVPGKNPTQKPSAVGVSKAVELVGMDTYAIDYTLSQAGTAPSKADFRELQSITENFFKKHMVDSYKASTQAELVDFTTSFVTAHFTYVHLLRRTFESNHFRTSHLFFPSILIQHKFDIITGLVNQFMFNIIRLHLLTKKRQSAFRLQKLYLMF